MSNGKQTNVIVRLDDVRLSFLYVAQPYRDPKNTDPNKKPSYCAHALMDPSHPGVELIKQAQRQVAQAEWGDSWMAVMTQLQAQDRLCLHDGNVTKAGQEEYKNKLFVSSNAKGQPNVFATVNGENVIIAPGHPMYPYSGCWGSLVVGVWSQTERSGFGKRINAGLQGVQFWRHDQAFGGGRVAKAAEFGKAPEAAGADAPPPGAALPAASGSNLI